MKLNIYAVFDSKAAAYASPFFMQRDTMALRAFTDLTNDRQSSINKHPEDYSLWKIGSYDDDTGLVESCKLHSIANAASLIIVNPTPTFPNMDPKKIAELQHAFQLNKNQTKKTRKELSK